MGLLRGGGGGWREGVFGGSSVFMCGKDLGLPHIVWGIRGCSHMFLTPSPLHVHHPTPAFSPSPSFHPHPPNPLTLT